MRTAVYIEGGGKSHRLRLQCQRAFGILFERCGLKVHFVAKGSRNDVFKWYRHNYLNSRKIEYVAMLIDSEDTIKDIEKTWEHLCLREKWETPAGAKNDQVLFMTTCMETWILAGNLSIPATASMELLDRKVTLGRLEKELPKGYKKGNQSFQLLAKVDPKKLEPLPSFARVRRILNEKLNINS